MYNKKLIIVPFVFLVSYQSNAQSTSTVDSSPDYSEFVERHTSPEEFNDDISSEVNSYIFLSINSFSDFELDEHALRISANCQPLESKGKFGVAVIEYDKYFIPIQTKPSSLPPFPTGGGTEGVHGVDVNKNCVRDDIEHYIFKKYGETDHEPFRLYLYEYAIWLNFFLIDGISDKSAQAVTHQSIKVANCLYKSDDFVSSDFDDLFANFHNTSERTEQFFENMRVLSGFMLEEDIGSIC